jgi:phosphoglycolate phosphatase/pyrophosphatase PpaX
MSGPVRRRAVVFDLDGTLIDSMPLVLAAITHAIEPFGRRTHEEIFARLGGPPDRFLGTLLDDLQHVPTARQRFDAFDRENAHLIRPYADADRVLKRLRDAGALVALWTGRDRTSTDWLLQRHQLGGYFQAVLCGDDLPSHKPDPAGLVEIMLRLGVTPAETLLVGDADVDVLGGVGGGVDTLLIRHARAVDPRITTQAWRIVDTPAAAFGVILGCLDTGG